MLQEKQTKTIWIFDMTCPKLSNIENMRLETRTNYMQFEFEIREGRRGLKVKVMSLVISAFDGGIILKKL